ncbi:MAG: DUF2079 domain-containing protein [Planctomycetaceae bacterium]|nr:DUF2079 domain-containing protein [Planctomycetaceae bacterium]
MSELLWPSDSNAGLVRVLGGRQIRDVTGTMQNELPPGSVLLRFLFIAVTATTAALWRHRSAGRIPAMGRTSADSAAAVEQLFREWSLVAVCSCAWWGLWMVGPAVHVGLQTFAASCLPLWIPLAAAAFVTVWFRALVPFQTRADQIIPDDAANPVSRLAVANGSGRWFGIVLAVSACWIAVSFWMNYCLYQQLLIPHGDSAMYEEHLWNVWHGKGFRSYLDQGLFLGEHIQVIHLLLLPLHVLCPSHLLLELAESVALGCCTIPLYKIAVRHTGDHKAACAISLAWLFFFPMHYLDIAIDQKTFRPIALGLPFLFWLIDLSERRRWPGVVVCWLLTLSAKEDYALVLFPLFLVLATDAWLSGRASGVQDAVGRRRAAIICMVFAGATLAYLLPAVWVVIPAFRSGHVVHYSRYFGDLGRSPGELVRTALTEPLRVAAVFFQGRTLIYGLVFLVPLMFLPLRRPLFLSAGAVTFGMLSLLQLGGAAGSGSDLPPVPYHHFHAPLLPILFWATAAAMGRSRRPADTRIPAETVAGDVEKKAAANANAKVNSAAVSVSTGPRALIAALSVLVCCLLTCSTSSLTPFGLTFWSKKSGFGLTTLYLPSDPRQQERAAMANVVVKQIPLTARVASTDFIHTRLTHCERSYDYSHYPRAVNNYQPGVPPDTDYIVIDTRHRYSEIHFPDEVPELQDGNSGWQLLPDTTNGAFLILRRQQ